MKISLTIQELEELLRQQKTLVIERLLGHTYYYNQESTDGHAKPMAINKEKFIEIGAAARFPDDLRVLKKYID